MYKSYKCPSGSDSPIGTQSSWPPPFWLPQNCKKNNGYWLSTGPQLTFCTKLAKPGRNQRPYIGKWKFCVFVLFGTPLFPLFFAPFLPLFCPLFALIRVTLGFFVVFPNKSHTLIRVTLGFKFFGLNKSHALIRVTFGVK